MAPIFSLLLLVGSTSAYLPVGPRAPPAHLRTSATHLRPIHLRSTPPLCSGDIVRGVGAGRELPAPSGINTLPEPAQAAIVVAILAAVGIGGWLVYGSFDALRGSFLWNLSRPTWPILGVIYLAAGIAHFTEKEGFENITPPNGTWGFVRAMTQTRARPALLPVRFLFTTAI